MFADPQIVAMIQKNFVPVAIDVWYEQRRQDTVGEFFYNVVDQGRNKGKDRDLTRQGLYCFTAEGVLLADGNNRVPEVLRGMFNAALTKFRSLPVANATRADSIAADPRFDRPPPRGGLIVDVYGKILLEGAAMQEAVRINERNAATSRDHLWITAAEVKALAPSQSKVGFKYPLPRSLALRIARYHLIDNIRGEPDLWNPAEVRALDVNLEVKGVAANEVALRLTGSVNLATNNGGRTYEANLRGGLVFDVKKQTFSRFDLVALGDATGDSTYTRGAPKGKFPLAFAFTLADPRAVGSGVPPQGARDLAGYLTRGN